MPCNDVTEVLSITLDNAERVIHYSLTKRTCGAAVGNPSLLRRWVDHRPALEVLDTTPDQMLQAIQLQSTTWEFLSVKHLLALQMGLRTLVGTDSGTTDSPCIVDSIIGSPTGTQLLAEVKVDLLTREIKACGGCGTCATPGVQDNS